jgi:hypothetical protein
MEVHSRSPGAALEGGGVVAVLALVGGDHHGGVVGRPLDALLHGAFAIGASVVAPARRIEKPSVRLIMHIFKF